MAEAIQIQLRSIPRAIPSLVTPILVLLIVTVTTILYPMLLSPTSTGG